MKLRPQRQDAPDINLAPLIDVVFLLLIFFMVSTTFKDDARLAIMLPEVEGEAVPGEEPRLLTVTIDASGRYVVADRDLAGGSAARLEDALRAVLADRDEASPPLLIKADADTPHQAVMTAMDVARRLGLRQVLFAATQVADASEPAAEP